MIPGFWLLGEAALRYLVLLIFGANFFKENEWGSVSLGR